LTWSFDDGTTATGASASHTFSQPGSHTATVTATDLGGFTASAAVTIAVITPIRASRRPAISALAVSPASFRAALSGPTVARAARHPRRGAIVTYRDTLAATTTFTVLRLLPGRAHGRSCVAPGKHNRHARRCVRRVPKGTFSHSDTAGANKFGFTGRLHNNKLPPGSYQLQAVPRTAAGAGRSVVAGFRIVR
jgi:PKD repeat protein